MSKIFSLFTALLLHLHCAGQVKYIRNVIYRNGETKVSVNPVYISKLQGGSYTTPSLFVDRDSCDCSRTAQVKFIPKYTAIYKEKELRCADLAEEIIISSNRPAKSMIKSNWASSYSGERLPASKLSFERDDEVTAVLNKILVPIGLSNIINDNRIILRAAAIPNAEAVVSEDGQRYILYNPEILDRIQRNDWASTGIFAHELAHHIFFQDVTRDSSVERQHALELEADKWAGYILRYLGAPMDSALAMTGFILTDGSSETHPAKEERIEQIRKGWKEADAVRHNSLIDKRYTLYYSKAMEYYENRKYPEALRYFDTTIEYNRFFSEAYLHRGICKIRSSRGPEAISDFNKAIFSDSLRSEAYSWRAYAYATSGFPDSSLADLSRLSQMKTNDYRYYITKGVALGNKQRFMDAITAFDSAIRIDASKPDVYYFKGYAYGSVNNNQEAVNNYTLSIQLDTLRENLPRTYYSRGYSYGLMNMHDQAIEDYTRSIALNDKDPNAFFYRGLSKIAGGRFMEAIGDFTSVIKMDSAAAVNAFYQRGLCYASLNRPGEAINDFNKTVRMAPAHMDAVFQRANANMNLRRFDLAIADMDTLVRRNPMPLNFTTRAKCLIELNRYNEALLDIQRSDSLNPNYSYNFYLLALARWKSGSYDSTALLESIDRAISLSNKDNEKGACYFLRAGIYKDMGRMTDACNDLKVSVRMNIPDAAKMSQDIGCN